MSKHEKDLSNLSKREALKHIGKDSDSEQEESEEDVESDSDSN